MDRRDALKKLGVGGAVAVAGPVLLQSYAVAATATNLLGRVNSAVTQAWLSGTGTQATGNNQWTRFSFNASNPVGSSSFAYTSTFLTAGFSQQSLGNGEIRVEKGGALLTAFTLRIEMTWTDSVTPTSRVRATYDFTYTPSPTPPTQPTSYTWVGSVFIPPAVL